MNGSLTSAANGRCQEEMAVEGHPRPSDTCSGWRLCAWPQKHWWAQVGLKTREGSMECPQEEARWEPRCRPLRAVSFQDVRIIPFPVHDVGNQPRLRGPDGEWPNMIL